MKKLLYILVPILIVIAALAILPPLLENRLNPRFDQAKMDEVKNRNAALYQEMIDNFEKYETEIKENPENAAAWSNMAVIADTFGDDALAERGYKKAIELEPTTFFARNNLAALYLRQNKYAEAEALYLEILRNNPADIQTNESLARLYASEKIKTKEDAKRVLEEAIKQTNDPYLKELLAKLERGEHL